MLPANPSCWHLLVPICSAATYCCCWHVVLTAEPIVKNSPADPLAGSWLRKRSCRRLAASWDNPHSPLSPLALGVLEGGAEVPDGPAWELGGPDCCGPWSRLRARSSAGTRSKSAWPSVVTLSWLSVLIFGREIRGMGPFAQALCSKTCLPLLLVA